MRSIVTKIPTKSILKRIVPSLSLSSHSLSTTTETKPEKLDRIADEILSLNAVELHDYLILLRLRLGLENSGPAGLSAGGAGPSGPAQPAAAGEAEAKEKTVFDVKLEKFDAATKIKIIKEVRSFTELGLKEAKELVEKAPVFVKKGVAKEEGEAILEKLKALGATVVLE